MTTTNLDLLVKRLHDAGIPPSFDPDTSQLLITMWRRVAAGQPITPEGIDQIADELGLERDFVVQTLRQMSEFDDRGNLIGIVGLSQKTYSHKLLVNGHALFAWCAWDALFLPLMLNQSTYVESPSPATKERVRVTLSPDDVELVSPTGAVLSFVIPQPIKLGVEAVEEVWTYMCSHIHFFATRHQAEQWLSERGIDGTVLTVREGFELGRRAFADLLQYA